MRIAVKGASGSGKTTLARQLAARLGVPHVELDALVVGRADIVVWLDLPLRVILPRLTRQTARGLVRREELWAGNRSPCGARTRSTPECCARA